jgi:hypothetical protein
MGTLVMKYEIGAFQLGHTYYGAPLPSTRVQGPKQPPNMSVCRLVSRANAARARMWELMCVWQRCKSRAIDELLACLRG